MSFCKGFVGFVRVSQGLCKGIARVQRERERERERQRERQRERARQREGERERETKRGRGKLYGTIAFYYFKEHRTARAWRKSQDPSKPQLRQESSSCSSGFLTLPSRENRPRQQHAESPPTTEFASHRLQVCESISSFPSRTLEHSRFWSVSVYYIIIRNPTIALVII